MADWGLSRLSGSHVKHLEIKSKKSSSFVRKTADSGFVAGRRRFPLLFTTGRGDPVASEVWSASQPSSSSAKTHQKRPSSLTTSLLYIDLELQESP
jgi:hypothetical protein